MRRLPAVFVLLLTVSSCKMAPLPPTYPKESLAQALEEQVMKEYNIPVKAKLAGSTLGVFVELPGILMDLGQMRFYPTVPLWVREKYDDGEFLFEFMMLGPVTQIEDRGYVKQPDEEGQRKELRQVSTILHRVLLSTDADIEFITMIVRDSLQGIDLLFPEYAKDTKLYYASQFSRTEFGDRAFVDSRIIPEIVATAVVTDFFTDIQADPRLKTLLGDYMGSGQGSVDLANRIVLTAFEFRDAVHRLSPETWYARQIDKDKVLVYVPLQQIDKPGALLFTVNNLEKPRGQNNAGTGTLLNVEWLTSGALPAQYISLGAPGTWANDFFLAPLEMPEFLAEQIKGRILSSFAPYQPAVARKPQRPEAIGSQEELLAALQGEEPSEADSAKSNPLFTTTRAKHFWEWWRPERVLRPEPADAQDIAQIFAEKMAYVTRAYQFEQVQGMHVVDLESRSYWHLPVSDFPLYRQKHVPEFKPAS